MDVVKSTGEEIHRTGSDRDLDVDTMTYTDNDCDFQTVGVGLINIGSGLVPSGTKPLPEPMLTSWDTGAAGDHASTQSMLNSCNDNKSCATQNYHGPSSGSSEKQEPGCGCREEGFTKGSGDGDSLVDAPPEGQGIVDDDNISDADCSDTSFDSNVSGDEYPASKSASKWAPSSESEESDSDDKTNEDVSTNGDVSVKCDASVKSDVSEELDMGGLSSDEEDLCEYEGKDGREDGHKYGRENGRDGRQRGSLAGDDDLSRTPDKCVSKDLIFSKYVTFQKISPYLYKYILGDGQIVYARSRVNACKVVLERVSAVVENCHVRTHRRDRIQENSSIRNLSKGEQVELANDAGLVINEDEDTGSESYMSSVSAGSNSESPSALPGSAPERNDSTHPKILLSSIYVSDHSEKRNGLFVCKICGAKYVKRWQLKSHINVHTEQYKCSKCGRIFVRTDSYDSHLLRHINGSRFVYSCTICGKGFSQASNRNTHMTLVHSHERNFTCDIYGTRWKRRYDLTAHIRTVHEGIKPKVSQPASGKKLYQGAVSIRKTVLPGMAIPMLKIRRPNGRLIFNMEIAIRR